MDRVECGLDKLINLRKHPKKPGCGIFSIAPKYLKRTYSSNCFKNVCKGLYHSNHFISKHQTPWKRLRKRKYSKNGNISLIPFSVDCNQTFPRRGRSINEDCSFKIVLSSEMVDSISAEGVKLNYDTLTSDAHSPSNINDSSVLLTHELIQASCKNVNPYKSVFIIDPELTKIYNVNNNACSLLNYKPKDFDFKTLFHLMKKVPSNPVSALAEGYFNKETGSMVLLSGKVVDFIKSTGTSISTSLWIRQYNQDGPSFAFVEPVQKVVGEIIVNKSGIILAADVDACLIFQCEVGQLLGLDIKRIIPSILLSEPQELVSNISYFNKQKVTGTTLDGSILPLSLSVKYEKKYHKTNEEAERKYLKIDITVYINLSGLLIINEEGIIECVCHHFVMFFFGYSQNKIVGQKITLLLPNFCEDFDCTELSHNRNYSRSPMGNSEAELDSFYFYSFKKDDKAESDENLIPETLDTGLTECYTLKSISHEDNKNKGDKKEDIINKLKDDDKKNMQLPLKMTKCSEDLLTPINESISRLSSDLENNLNISNISVTPQKKALDSSNKSYLHLDIISYEEDDELATPINESEEQVPKKFDSSGGLISLNESNYEISKMHDIDFLTPANKRYKNILQEAQISTSTPSYRDKNESEVFKEGRYKGTGRHSNGKSIDVCYAVLKQSVHQNRNVYCVWISFDHANCIAQDTCTITSSNNSTIEHSLGQAIKLKAAKNKSCTNSVSFASQCEEEQTRGEYNKNYTTLCQIGKGAFGWVRMAYRNSDKLLVVSKFILKDRVNDDFWIWDKTMGKEVPLEISLLPTLSHPNIVSVYDIFENELYFQLIMEKHGSGMDLFEFIDRVPKLDEPLISYIYRQIVSAVEYLHSLHILHRDIKDENIIINHKFEVKLIDFGSATFFNEKSEFCTFYGTTEYCSPEVLAGNKYSGPELEMWSMGVTLYVLTYSINPFEDAEETLNGILKLPHKVSEGLEQLLTSLLCKDPLKRCTLKELLASEWLLQPVDISKYDFTQVVQCDPREANPDQYYNAGTMSGFITPQDPVLLSDTNTAPTSLSHNDYAKLQADSGENTEYYNDEYDESWDEISFS